MMSSDQELLRQALLTVNRSESKRQADEAYNSQLSWLWPHGRPGCCARVGGDQAGQSLHSQRSHRRVRVWGSVL